MGQTPCNVSLGISRQFQRRHLAFFFFFFFFFFYLPQLSAGPHKATKLAYQLDVIPAGF